jgi:hypothetical protein
LRQLQRKARQGVDERAPRRLTGIATPHGVSQRAFHSAEVGNLRSNVRKVTSGKRARFGACASAIIA